MVTSDREPGITDTTRGVQATEEVERISGKLKQQSQEEKLMRSVLEADDEQLRNGHLLADAITQGIQSFTPDLFFANLVQDFKLAKKLYGDVLIRELSGYSSEYVKKNINVPEFRKTLKNNIEERVEDLKKNNVLDAHGSITDKGLQLSSLVLYMEELDHLLPKGFGEKEKKEASPYGEKKEVSDYKKTRYRDLAIRASIKRALRRGHTRLTRDDLKVVERQGRGRISLVYALDASGSMKGLKLKTAKKAGIALSFKAIQEKNKVGLVVFGSDIKTQVDPTLDFMALLRSLAKITASKETDLKKTILRSLELFPRRDTKHLVLLTDALPTKGTQPKKETLQAASAAKDAGVTISVIGINLDEEGQELAEKVAEMGNGRLYRVSHLEEVDKIILEDYAKVKG